MEEFLTMSICFSCCDFFRYLLNFSHKQESIPVGRVPPALHRTGGYPRRDSPAQGLLLNRDPPLPPLTDRMTDTYL